MSDAATPSWLPYVALLACQCCWSSFHAIGRYATTQITPFVIPATRSLIAAPLLGVILLLTNRKLLTAVSLKQLPYFLLLGAIGSGYNQVLFIWGVGLTSAADAGISQPLITIFTLVLAVALKKEKLTKFKLFGTLISLFGCFVIVTSEALAASDDSDNDDLVVSSSSDRILGWCIFLVQCVVYACFVVMNKWYADRFHPLTMAFYLFTLGGLFNLTVGIPAAIYAQDWSTVPTNVYWDLLYIGVVGTFCAQCLYSYSSSKLPPTVSSLSICLSPLISSVMGWIVLGEHLTIYDGIGAIFIVAGVVTVVYGRSREVKAQQQYAQLATSEELEQSYNDTMSPFSAVDIDKTHTADKLYKQDNQKSHVELSQLVPNGGEYSKVTPDHNGSNSTQQANSPRNKLAGSSPSLRPRSGSLRTDGSLFALDDS